MSKHLRWAYSLVGALMVAACSGNPAPSYNYSSEPTDTQAAPAVTPSADATLSPTPSGPNLSLVAINVTQEDAGGGYQNVTVNLGVKNSGNELGWIGGMYSSGRPPGPEPSLGRAALQVAEGRSYPQGQGCVFCAVTPIPPGWTVCGFYPPGAFAPHFDQVPAAAHPTTFDMPPFQVDLSKPLGSCPLPDVTALPTSFTAKSPATANDPGFKVEVKGGTLTTVDDNSSFHPYRHGVSLTMVNNDSLDPLYLGFGENGTGVMALTDKGYLMPVGNRVDAPGCEADGFGLGPGQTATWNLCFNLTVLGVDVGSPIALLFVAPTGAYGLARLTS